MLGQNQTLPHDLLMATSMDGYWLDQLLVKPFHLNCTFHGSNVHLNVHLTAESFSGAWNGKGCSPEIPRKILANYSQLRF